jgi:uncharacterized protein (TIGR04255 family)
VERSHTALFLSNSPLVFTLAKIQFDPVLAVEKYLPDIQEELRNNGFPKLRERRIAGKIEKQDDNTIAIRHLKQWEFHNQKNDTSILLDQEGLGIQTTNYSTFEEFSKLIELALKHVAERLGIGDILRCGLRYIDAVDHPENESLDLWVSGNLLGFPDMEGFRRRGSHSMTELEGTTGTSLSVRCSWIQQGIVLPPELLPCDLAFQKNPMRETPFALIDLDHSSSQAFPYDFKKTMKQLSLLHDSLDLAFRESVTPHALNTWQ